MTLPRSKGEPVADQIPDPIDVIASEPDARHPMLDGAPVMIGDCLVADHPDDYDHHIEFHVGSLMYDAGRDPGSEVDRGWTVSPINIEFEDDAPYEWPLSECKRVVPIVDDDTRDAVEGMAPEVGGEPCGDLGPGDENLPLAVTSPVPDDETREDVLDAVRHAKDTLTEVAVRYPSWGSELRLAGRTLDALAAAYLGRTDG